MELPVIHGQQVGKPAKNQQPTGIQIDGNAQDFRDSKAGGSHRHWRACSIGGGPVMLCLSPPPMEHARQCLCEPPAFESRKSWAFPSIWMPVGCWFLAGLPTCWP